MTVYWLPAQHAEDLWAEIVDFLERVGQNEYSKPVIDKYIDWLELLYNAETIPLMGLIYSLAERGIKPKHLYFLIKKYSEPTEAQKDLTQLFCWLKKKNKEFVVSNHRRAVVSIYYAMVLSRDVGGARRLLTTSPDIEKLQEQFKELTEHTFVQEAA